MGQLSQPSQHPVKRLPSRNISNANLPPSASKAMGPQQDSGWHELLAPSQLMYTTQAMKNVVQQCMLCVLSFGNGCMYEY
ncbi:hypothetical protein EON65_16245 [archaeon]|nr:MAG: hypothetical protein EON65_16245 [archaeon]